MEYYYIVETEMGWVAVVGTEDGVVTRLELPRETREEAEEALKEGNNGWLVESMHDFAGIAEQIAAYFAGERVNFDCAVSPADASEFDRLVWEAACEIGYGDVRTYSWIAERIGKKGASRAVGSALGRNPVPLIIPCHRVVRSDGGLGGFSAGLRWKIRLLELERVER